MALIKISLAMAAAGGAVLASTYGRTQHELKDSVWFREAAQKVANHEGVHKLIGPPPLEMGDVTRLIAETCSIKPLLHVEPTPLYIIDVPVKGNVGEGRMLLYLNYLVPIEVVRTDINAWNVGLIEVLVGKNKDDRFVVQ